MTQKEKLREIFTSPTRNGRINLDFKQDIEPMADGKLMEAHGNTLAEAVRRLDLTGSKRVVIDVVYRPDYPLVVSEMSAITELVGNTDADVIYGMATDSALSSPVIVRTLSV